MAENAPTAVIQEAYVHRVSTRSVDDLVKALGMSGWSKSRFGRLCGEIDERCCIPHWLYRKDAKPDCQNLV